ncbi:MAG: serine/threonine protein kinase [Deltaproteobacteria bacterium]|nr:MAG: serine/threonine protein kinase [Deltaproteobacteria bacterium]
MILPAGLQLGERYRVRRLVGGTRRCRVYLVDSDDHGPGRLALKVARHDDARTLEDILRGRRAIEDEFARLVSLQQTGTSAIPQPVDLLRQYAVGQPARSLLLPDPVERIREPYLLREFVNGQSLRRRLAAGPLDDELALGIALRLVQLGRRLGASGFALDRWRPEAFVIDAVGENLGIVDLSECAPAPPNEPLLPPGLARLLVSLLGGATAPDWPLDAAHRRRWEQLIDRRSILPALRPLLLAGLSVDARPTLRELEGHLREQLGQSPIQATTPAPRPPTSAAPLAPGERVGDRYRVRSTLAQGGRGVVHLATDEQTGAEVAIKANAYRYDTGRRFQADLEARRAELRHEFRILRRFASRTNMLPQPLELCTGTARGGWFDLDPALGHGEPRLVMKRIAGVPLMHLRAAGRGEGAAVAPGGELAPLPPRFVLRVVAQLAELLDVIHGAGFVYQDLKPENVLFDPASGNVFLVDLASVCPWSPEEGLDRACIAFGSQTHGFAAPEFASRWHRVDPRFDLYSLGATAFAMLTGVSPERLAIEREEEYPELPRDLLHDQPAPVRALVEGCLAPIDDRFPSAAAVRESALRGRLLLSPGRPTDVRDLRSSVRRSGARLEWTLPRDPRVQRIRIRIAGGEGEQPGTWTLRASPTCTAFELPVPIGDAGLDCLVQTLAGDGTPSRGVGVRLRPRPGLGHFAVHRDFAAHRLVLRGLPPCEAIVIRASTTAPPAHPDDGEAVPHSTGSDTIVDEDGIELRRVAPPGVLVHYAAFVLHAEGAVVPAFADAVALPDVPDPGRVSLRQSTHGVTLRWEHPCPGLHVLREIPGREAVEILVHPGAMHVTDTAVPDGSTAIWRLRCRVEEVTSGPLAVLEARRWPRLPPPVVSAGVGTLRLEAPPDLDDQVTGLLVLLEGRPVARASVDALPLDVPVPGGGHVRPVVRYLLNAEEEGPETALDVEVPGPATRPALALTAPVLPLRFAWTVPERAAHWPSRPTVSLRRVQQGSDHVVDAAEDVVPVRGGSLEDAGALPAVAGTWTLALTFPDGSALTSGPVDAAPLEQLAPPRLVPRLGALDLLPSAGDEGRVPARVDVEILPLSGPATGLGDREDVWADARRRRLRAVPVPCRLPSEEGRWLAVRWRRSVAGMDMPFSPAAQARTLHEPPAIAAPTVLPSSGGVRLLWSHPARPGTTFVVERCDTGPEGAIRRVLIHEGPGTAAMDVSGVSCDEWRIVARCDGLSSPEVRVPGVGPPPLATVQPAASRVAAARVRFMGIGPRRPVVEVTGCAAGQWLVVREHRPGQTTLPPAANPPWAVPNALAVQRATGPRSLLVLDGDAPAVEVIAFGPAPTGAWRLLGSSARMAGRMVRVTPDPDEQALWCALPEGAGTPPPWTGWTLGALDARGRVMRLPVGASGRVDLPAAVPLSAITLHPPRGGAIALMTRDRDEPLRPERRVWLDAATCFCAAVLDAVREALDAPVLRTGTGLACAVEFVLDGRVVAVGLEPIDISPAGRVRVRRSVTARGLAWQDRATVRAITGTGAQGRCRARWVAALTRVVRAHALSASGTDAKVGTGLLIGRGTC